MFFKDVQNKSLVIVALPRISNRKYLGNVAVSDFITVVGAKPTVDDYRKAFNYACDLVRESIEKKDAKKYVIYLVDPNGLIQYQQLHYYNVTVEGGDILDGKIIVAVNEDKALNIAYDVAYLYDGHGVDVIEKEAGFSPFVSEKIDKRDDIYDN